MKPLPAILALLTLVAVVAPGAVASADGWECVAGSKSKCYVSYVRFFPRGTVYVKAKLHDPDDTTTCSYVSVRLERGTDNLDTVRAVEALLLTALTTGMPIRFYRLEQFGDDSDCFASGVSLSSPGH